MILSYILPDKFKQFLKRTGIRTYLTNKIRFPCNRIPLDKNRFLFFDPFEANPVRMSEDYHHGYLIIIWKKLLNERFPSIGLDIGANYGLFTLAAPEKVKIFAFEPNPHIVAYLRKSVLRSNLLPNTQVVGKAISNKIGSSAIKVKKGVFHRIESGSGYLCAEPQIESAVFCIETTTLDKVFNDKIFDSTKIKRIVTKIDVEGYEPAVFEGGYHYLKRFERIDGICEFNDEYINRANFSPEEFYVYMSESYFMWGYFPHSRYFYELNEVSFEDLKRGYYKIRPSGPNVHFNIIFSTHRDIAALLRTILPIELVPIAKNALVKEQIP